MKTRIQRRTFLRGLGGVPSLRRSSAPSPSGQRRARRLPSRSSSSRCSRTTGASRRSSSRRSRTARSRPATSWRRTSRRSRRIASKLLIPRGIRAMNEWTQSNRGSGASAAGRGQANDPHLNVAGSYFTLQPVTPNGTDPFSFDTAYKFNAKPIGSSLDHVMAQQLSPQRDAAVHAGWQQERHGAVGHLVPEGRQRRRQRRCQGLSRPRHAVAGVQRPDGPVRQGRHRRRHDAGDLRAEPRQEGLRPREGRSRRLQAPGHERGGQEQGRCLGDALQRHGDHHCWRRTQCTTAIATGIGGDVSERQQDGQQHHERGHDRSRRRGHVLGHGGARGHVQLQPGHLPEVPAELRLQRASASPPTRTTCLTASTTRA